MTSTKKVKPVCNDQLDSHGSADEVVGTIGEICEQQDKAAVRLSTSSKHDVVLSQSHYSLLLAVAEAAKKWQTMRLSVHTEQLRIDREHELHNVLAALASVRQ